MTNKRIHRRRLAQKSFPVSSAWATASSAPIFSARDAVYAGHAVAEPVPVEIVGDVCVIDFYGSLTLAIRGRDLVALDDFFGALDAAAESSAKTVLLRLNCPGGEITAASIAASAIRGIAEERRVVALISGCALGAGYWMAAAAGEIWLESPVVEVAGLGVSMPHVDISQAEGKQGRRHSLVTAGYYKGAFNPYQPLSGDHRAYLMGIAEALRAVMLHEIVDLRPVLDFTELLATEGKTYLGAAAIERRLADGFATVETFTGRDQRK